ncbi:MAG: protein translocase subunit SecD, partial [Kiritimatiellae bacterium]|nr:protein translocase subunit SecD [Kiritimatiellia bacterium]
MKSSLWWRWLAIAVLAVSSVFLATPFKDKIRLGLDLRGGYSFTVELDKTALEETVRERHPDASDGEIANFVAEAAASADDTAVEIIRNRIDAIGTEEPVITKGKNGRIYVQMPGASEEQRARAEKTIRSVAFLDFRLVSARSAELRAKLLDKGQAPRGYKMADMGERGPCYVRDLSVPEPSPRELRTFGNPPQGFVFMLEKDRVGQADVYYPIFVARRADLTGANLSRATVSQDDMTGDMQVNLRFDSVGTRKFAEITRKNCSTPTRRGRQLAVVLDGVVYSAPVLEEPITGGNARIHGSFTLEDATILKNVLNAGAMPAPLKFLGKRFVNPTLGEDSIADARVAICVGVAAVLLFMLLYYRAMGLVADLALALNFVLLPLCAVVASGILSQISGDSQLSGGSILRLPVLTLPGIAGILLSIGMAVDANVLIYERTREEVKAGKPGYPSVMAGYQRAFSAIFDGNLTTVLTGVILFVVGTGLVRGFAVTLVAGIAASMFTALFVTKTVFGTALSEQTSWKPRMMQAVKDDVAIPFVANFRKYLCISVAIIVATLAATGVKYAKNPANVFAVDFTGGARVSYAVRPAAEATAAEATAAEAEPAAEAAEAATEDLSEDAERRAAEHADLPSLA